MPTLPVNLIKGDRTDSRTDYRDALPVNMYAVPKEILGAKGYILSYPGITTIGTGTGIDRGAMYNERFKEHYRVSGTDFIRVNFDGSTTVLGTVSGSDQVALPYSFNTQAVIANGQMFLYSPGVGFSEVTDANLGNPIDGVWVDGYYFLTDGEYIYHTDIGDESSIDPLKFATAEFMPDPSFAVGKTQNNKVIVFGRYTIEYFINAATENFAFQRVEERTQKIGIVATHAKCESGNGWYFTGGRKGDSIGVYVLGIGDSAKVSTREIDKILAQYTEPDLINMRMESRNNDDITCIIIHLPNHTLCFNEAVAKSLGINAAWSLLKTDIAGDTPYHGINGVFDAIQGKWVYGNRYNTKIGYLDDAVCTHFGEKVEGLMYSPLIDLESMSIDEIEIDTIPGHTVTGDATVAISLTYDGLSYGSEWFSMYGLPLDYRKQFIIRRLGYVRNNVGFKFRMVSQSRMAFSKFMVTYG